MKDQFRILPLDGEYLVIRVPEQDRAHCEPLARFWDKERARVYAEIEDDAERGFAEIDLRKAARGRPHKFKSEVLKETKPPIEPKPVPQLPPTGQEAPPETKDAPGTATSFRTPFRKGSACDRILNALHNAGGKLATPDLIEQADVVKGSSAYQLNKLVDKGLIETEKQGLRRYWWLSSKFPAQDEGSTPLRAPPSKGGVSPKRRFTDKPVLSPERVKGLDENHPALVEGRTLFPTTVVDPKDSQRLLVSGRNSRKLGEKVVKGIWKDFPIYQLSLEERATCPRSCHMWSTCYGNGMPLARRHKHGDDLIAGLARELDELSADHPQGFVVRLHVLGDFYSVDYVAAWVGFLKRFPALHVFGFTAWERGSEIGAAIKRVTEKEWDRFAIRFSDPKPKPQGATTLWTRPDTPTVDGAVVCPAQTGKTECCGTCGLCWTSKEKPIAFIAHGKLGRPPKSDAVGRPPETQQLVEEFLKNGGQIRHVDRAVSSQPFALGMWLEDRGHTFANQPKHKGYIVDDKKLTAEELYDLVDKLRVKEGLEPLRRHHVGSL